MTYYFQVDLTGGYYDAGDNVKFNFPMAFSTTMLSWATLEYGKRMGTEVGNAKAAIRWATDYLLKCATATPGKLYVGVGDPNTDHKCWERPEDMDTSRTVYWVTSSNPGSDVAGETAAALAAASMVFRKSDPSYARLLLKTAKNVMQFAMQYRGTYSDSLGSAVCPFYCSYSGYEVSQSNSNNVLISNSFYGLGPLVCFIGPEDSILLWAWGCIPFWFFSRFLISFYMKDELLWGATWLLRATHDVSYFHFIQSLGANKATDIFSWDNKYAGARVLLSRVNFQKETLRFSSNARTRESSLKILN